MSNKFNVNDLVKVSAGYYNPELRLKHGKVISTDVSSVFMVNGTVVELNNSGLQITLSADNLVLVAPAVVEKKSKFNVGDRIVFNTNAPNSHYHGKTGKIVGVWTEDPKRYNIRTDDGWTTDGSFEVNLDPAPPKEGETIRPDQVKVGMVVKVSYTSTSGTYEQTSTSQGKVVRVNTTSYRRPVPFVETTVGSERALFIHEFDDVYTLVKDVPVDEIAVALKKAKPGSVVQIEDDGTGNFILTFVKSIPEDNGRERWIKIDSRYPSTTLTSESTVRSKIQSLDQLVVQH